MDSGGRESAGFMRVTWAARSDAASITPTICRGARVSSDDARRRAAPGVRKTSGEKEESGADHRDGPGERRADECACRAAEQGRDGEISPTLLDLGFQHAEVAQGGIDRAYDRDREPH